MVASDHSSEFLVSIVMAAFNCEDYVAQAVESLLNQTYSNIEVLVADDASTDATRSILDSYMDDRIRRFHNDRNLGYLHTCNKLLKRCVGKYIIFQDADDWSDERRVEILSGYLERDHELYAVGSAIYKVDQSSVIVSTRRFPEIHEEVFDLMANRGKATCVGSVMFRREVLSTIGYYREYFDRQCFEDVDWLYRLMERHRFANCPQPLYYYRNNPKSVTSNFDVNKIIMREVVHVLGKQRAAVGQDMISQDRLEELQKVRDHLITDLQKIDPFHFDRIRLNRAVINRNGIEFRSAVRNMMKKGFYYPQAYAILLSSLAKYTLGIERYYVLRDFMANKSRRKTISG